MSEENNSDRLEMQLESADVVEESVYLMDARKSNYHLADGDDSSAGPLAV